MTNAVESVFADRDPAGSSKAQPAGGTMTSIKALFRAAKALLCRPDAPQPQARRRRGDTDKGAVVAWGTTLRRLAIKTGATAQGRYAALQSAQEPIVPVVDAYATATVSTATTLEWLMNLWDANSGMEDSGGLDDSFDTKQNYYYPQP